MLPKAHDGRADVPDSSSVPGLRPSAADRRREENMQMKAKAFGYAKRQLSGEGLLAMREVSFVASPAELRRIAAFLVQSAEDIEKHASEFGHNHLSAERDLHPWPQDTVDVIVSRGE